MSYNPDTDRGDRKQNGHSCYHYQRKFDADASEPDGKSKRAYTCTECGKRKTMKVWKI